MEADAGSGRPCVVAERHERHLPLPEPPTLPPEPLLTLAAADASGAACTENDSAAALDAARAAMPEAGSGAVAGAAPQTENFFTSPVGSQATQQCRHTPI